MTPPKNIILVGFMATGKSHVGKILSQQTGWPLVDADREIARRAGKSIDQLFQDEGEPAFRALEVSAITELCSGSGRIIAAGGGTFVDPDNRRRMLESGLVCCLSARPETIYRRIGEPTDGGEGVGGSAASGAEDAGGPAEDLRPLLAGDNTLERIKTLLAQRSEAYAQAHHTIETDSLTPEEVAQRIVLLWNPGPMPAVSTS